MKDNRRDYTELAKILKPTGFEPVHDGSGVFYDPEWDDTCDFPIDLSATDPTAAILKVVNHVRKVAYEKGRRDGRIAIQGMILGALDFRGSVEEVVTAMHNRGDIG